jgi:hypothetical protein
MFGVLPGDAGAEGHSILHFILRDGTSLWDWILRRFAPETRG